MVVSTEVPVHGARNKRPRPKFPIHDTTLILPTSRSRAKVPVFEMVTHEPPPKKAKKDQKDQKEKELKKADKENEVMVKAKTN